MIFLLISIFKSFPAPPLRPRSVIERRVSHFVIKGEISYCLHNQSYFIISATHQMRPLRPTRLIKSSLREVMYVVLEVILRQEKHKTLILLGQRGTSIIFCLIIETIALPDHAQQNSFKHFIDCIVSSLRGHNKPCTATPSRHLQNNIFSLVNKYITVWYDTPSPRDMGQIFWQPGRNEKRYDSSAV